MGFVVSHPCAKNAQGHPIVIAGPSFPFRIPCSLVPGPWSLVPGPCSLVPIPYSLVPVPRSLPYSRTLMLRAFILR